MCRAQSGFEPPKWSSVLQTLPPPPHKEQACLFWRNTVFKGNPKNRKPTLGEGVSYYTFLKNTKNNIGGGPTKKKERRKQRRKNRGGVLLHSSRQTENGCLDLPRFGCRDQTRWASLRLAHGAEVRGRGVASPVEDHLERRLRGPGNAWGKGSPFLEQTVRRASKNICLAGTFWLRESLVARLVSKNRSPPAHG